MNQDLVFKVADLLNKTFTVTNKSQRLSIEEELETISQDQENYLQALIGILSASSPDINPQIKNSAAIQINRFIKNIDMNSTPTQTILCYVHSLFTTLTSPILDMQLRASLGYALAPIFIEASDEILSSIFPYIFVSLDGDIPAILGSLRIIRSIFNGETQNASLTSHFKYVSEKLIEIAKNIVEKLRAGEIDMDLAHILSEICGCFNTMLEHFEVVNRRFLGDVKDMANLAEIFAEIIGFVIIDNPIGDNCLIYVTDLPFHIKINNSKNQLLQGLNLLLLYLSENKNNDFDNAPLMGLDMPDSPFIAMLQQLIEKLTVTLHLIISQPNYEDLLQKSYVSDYFIEILLILFKLSSEKRFSWLFLQSFKGIIIEICFPLIKAFGEDYVNINSDPEEFANASIEICERQGTDTFKTCASQLLLAISENVDGALSFIMTFTIQTIMLALARTPVDSYVGISEYKNTKIFLISEEQRIEVLLLALCVLSDNILARKDLIGMLEQFLSTHTKSLLDTSSIIIHHRICMIIQYFGLYLFNELPDSFSHFIQIILSFSDPQATNQAVSLQASSALYSIIQADRHFIRLHSLIYSVVSSLVSIIPQQRSNNFFEVLYQITSQSFEAIKPYFSVLIPHLVNKIQSELQILSTSESTKKKKKTNLIISKCWNIIRFIAESENITVEETIDLEQKLIPLFEYLKNPYDIEFDDDIVLFEIALIKKSLQISEVCWILFSHIKLIQEKNDNTFIQIFPLLSCYIYYGKEVLAKNTQALQVIAEMCSKCLVAKYKKRTSEAINSEAALIYQQMLHTFPGLIDGLIPQILSVTIDRMTSNVKHDFFMIRLLNVILASFSYNCQLSMSILSQTHCDDGENCLNFILQKITINSRNFSHAYDKKVAVIGLVSLISQPTFPEQVSNMLTVIFQVIIDILNPDAQLNKIKKGKEKNNLEVVKTTKSTTISIKGISKKKAISEEEQANMALKALLTPMDEVDECTYFKNMMKTLQASNVEAIKYLVGSLNVIQAEILQKIIMSKRVQLNNFNDTEVRRIVKAKSKHSNN
ncbi:unnamed protein product [Blepharisma stoltei]|uniref:Importin-7/11-like TPR repeats domain-containing protein n=1 Tax=Blepharisma stoltei TaxID=1481888 RepID=A0AAU9JF82_9CILI|nr:unnamed protein product [Blepharisma stoltei]